MSSIAFIGLGAMGSRMARRLLAAGHRLTVHNRTPERAEPLVAAGATAAATPAAAASEAEAVITMVTDPAALEAVTDGPDGIAAGLAPGAAAIDMSTVGPAAIHRLAASLPSGAGVLDAPVLGSIGEAEQGTLQIYVGGPAGLAQRWMPVLSALGTPRHVGDLGSGAAAKLVANTSLFGVLGVLGESVALGEGLGLSRAATLDVLATTPLAEQARRRARVLTTDEVLPARFALSLARKDADLVLAAGERAGRDLRVAGAARSWLADAEAAGHGTADYLMVLRTIAGAA
jgi:3-hydroxyisobutyrate dehydrogenase-like beta-hydroxyacid dehydrogenase